MVRTQNFTGIEIADFHAWQSPSSEKRRDELAKRGVSHYFCLACFFGEGEQLKIKGETNETECHVANATATKGYVLLHPNNSSVDRDPNYLAEFNSQRERYEKAGALIKRWFVHDDVGGAGFLWETQQ